MKQVSTCKLSICIPTFNRAAFIGTTLESVLSQVTSDCEIVVSDNASTDNTEQIVSEYASRFNGLRYVKNETNKGLDFNFDSAIGLARGEYCWLFTDDDLMKPGAIATVLKAIEQNINISLIVVNVEQKDLSMSKVLKSRWIDCTSDRVYKREEMDCLFADLDETLWYIGNLIIERAVWIARERQRYYGCTFIHVAVIYQKPLPGKALVIADPLVTFRLGNSHSFGSTISEVLLLKWPSLVELLAVSPSARRRVRSAEPWRNPRWLLMLRGAGIYSMTEYGKWIGPRLNSIREKLSPIVIALLPGVLVNMLFLCYCAFHQDRGERQLWMTQSRFYPRNWRAFKRESAIVTQ